MRRVRIKSKDIEERLDAVMAVYDVMGVRDLAGKLRVTMQAVIDEVEASDRYDLLVGVRLGNGYAELKKADWSVERLS